MDKAIVFDQQRLLVGWRLCDWSPVWYEPIASEDGDAPVYDGNGGAETGLYKLSAGDPGYREPMTGEVAWFPPVDWKTFQAAEKKEKLALHKQFMADAYKYLSTDNRREERAMEKDLHRLHDTRWYKFFEAAKLYKKRDRQARSSAGAAATATAEREQEEVVSEDSGFESNIGQASRLRTDSEMAPPPPPIAKKNGSAGSSGTGRSSNISNKRKRETQSKQAKVPKANYGAQHDQEDNATQSFDAEDSVRHHTRRQSSVSLMSGGLGSNGGNNPQPFTGNPSSDINNQHSNNFTTAHTETTEYEDDYVFSRRPSENPRVRSRSRTYSSNRFSSPEGTGQERNASHSPHQDFRPFNRWGDVEGATTSNSDLRPMSHPRSEPAINGYMSASPFADRRAATEVDYGGYNDGLDDEQALKRAMRESAAPESRTDLATGYGDGISTTNGRLPEGVYPSIEAGDEEDNLWEE
ncbi:hypothetical protein KC343_g1035 [Hortaea werneckii]|uniref:Uncharacterized protein n=1 Tax=Hortaea werneckii TaxID=91943 RepID=A0A3M7GU29_HORWE|nr:hypothetical protein KC352_g10211 [Hortaea werneckii]KAI7571579.1 hypothetical protein KC317_g1509 [Hortaea werneckii]KAI7626437.1 hypothetical protein KC346_g1278 [Hortaea werneckii]KAI7636853.1 hypothetical protein KC343_g1035 [Hortaea werneckii]KAI7671472.1 hypothetical protein KC319_g5554 [Hortaea werneckii]